MPDLRFLRAPTFRAWVLWALLPATHACAPRLRTATEDRAPSPVSVVSTIEHRSLLLEDGSPLRYSLVAHSSSSAAAERTPLILVLHYGAPNDSTPEYFGAEILERLVLPALSTLPAVFVAPDAPGRRGWADPRSERTVLALLAHLQQSRIADVRRTILTGYSVGGMGTWYFVGRHPERFCGAVPIASFPMVRAGRTAADRQDEYRALKADTAGNWTTPFQRVPLYVIHSHRDAVMPPSAVEYAVARLKAHGADVTFTQLDTVSHGDTRAYIAPLREALPWISKALASASCF